MHQTILWRFLDQAKYEKTIEKIQTGLVVNEKDKEFVKELVTKEVEVEG